MTSYEWAGIGTHLVVLGLGLAGVARRIVLPRGRRTGAGLILMALSMYALVLAPLFSFAWIATVAHPALFGVALWLLIGPSPPARRELRVSERDELH